MPTEEEFRELDLLLGDARNEINTLRRQLRAALDSNWKASMPYPTWPFTRVNPKELMKAERMWQRQNKTDPLEGMEEAPL
jgi:hypothetical protein